MTEQNLYRIIYKSTAENGLEEEDVRAILETSRRNNAARDVTGVLLFNGVSFLQVLEGPAGAIDDLMGAITGDPRHRNVAVLVREPIHEPSFPDWAMAQIGEQRITDELDGIASLDDIVSRITSDRDFLETFLTGCADVL
jgi:hypothetical protein